MKAFGRLISASEPLLQSVVNHPPMPPCDRCGTISDLPYRCRYCGGTFCGEHRLPENHACPGLNEWGDPSGIFDSGFDASAHSTRSDGRGGVLARVGIETGPGGPLAYLRGNVTFIVLALMWATFLLQHLVIGIFGVGAHDTVFVLHSERLVYIWTWVTSVFAHSPASLIHILFNSIVLYFFGPIVERKVGSLKFSILFLGAGVIAGLSQVGIALVLGEPGGVVGASGAILAIMGVLTVLNPDLRVLLFFIIPMPLWVLTIGFAAFSIFVIFGAGIGAGNIAHLAHLVGLVVGLAYGGRLRQQGASVPDELHLGGRRPPRGPGRGRL